MEGRPGNEATTYFPTQPLLPDDLEDLMTYVVMYA